MQIVTPPDFLSEEDRELLQKWFKRVKANGVKIVLIVGPPGAPFDEIADDTIAVDLDVPVNGYRGQARVAVKDFAARLQLMQQAKEALQNEELVFVVDYATTVSAILLWEAWAMLNKVKIALVVLQVDRDSIPDERLARYYWTDWVPGKSPAIPYVIAVK